MNINNNISLPLDVSESKSNNTGVVKVQVKDKEDLWYLEEPRLWMKVGQIVILRFYDMTVSLKSTEDLELIKHVDIPAIVSKSVIDIDMPVHSVRFANRWSGRGTESGAKGGWLEMSEFPVWRYLSPNQEIPQMFLEDMISTFNDGDYFYGFDKKSLFYISTANADRTARLLVYPFGETASTKELNDDTMLDEISKLKSKLESIKSK